MDARVDLHVHSRFSGRPTEWLLRRLGSGECYTSPREVYDACRGRGMRFVTVTDHHAIDCTGELLRIGSQRGCVRGHGAGLVVPMGDQRAVSAAVATGA